MMRPENERPPGWPVLYSTRAIPDGSQAVRDMDMTISWEVSNSEGNPRDVYVAGIDELNSLLMRRVEKILEENDGVCVHIKHEKVVHSINHLHDSSVIVGTYYLTVYR